MPSAVEQLIARFYGGLITTDDLDSDVTVNTAATQLVAANSRRTKVRMCNFGGANVVLGRTAAVTTTTGIQLSPGQTIEFDWTDDLEDVARQWFGISAFAGNAVHIIETVVTSSENPG